jgi:hypothetical protein
MSNRHSWLTHPIQAWHAFTTTTTEQADAEARAAGLTVEVLPNGVRRYHDPRLDQLAPRPVTTAGQDWSPVRLVRAGQARTPAAPVTAGDRRTERGGLFPRVGPGLTAPTAPHQGRMRAAFGGPPKKRVAP